MIKEMSILHVFYIFPNHLSESLRHSIQENNAFFHYHNDYSYHPVMMKYIPADRYKKMNDVSKMDWFRAHFRSRSQPVLIIFFPNRVFLQKTSDNHREAFYGNKGVFYGIPSNNIQSFFFYHVTIKHLSQWESNSIQIIKINKKIYFTDLSHEQNPPFFLVSHDADTITNLKTLHDFFSRNIDDESKILFRHYFEKINIITLPGRKNRLQNVLNAVQLNSFAQYHDAIRVNKIESDNKILKKGQIACFMSHQEIYSKFLKESVHDFLWVMEDDIYFPVPFGVNDASLEWIGQTMIRIFQNLQSYDPDWDLFYWGHCWDTTLPANMHPHGLSKTISRIERPYCTHAMMIRRRVLEKYFPYEIKTAIDRFWLDRIQRDRLRVYSSPLIYQNPRCGSNIGYIIDFNRRRFPVHVGDMMMDVSVKPVVLSLLLITMIIFIFPIRRKILFRVIE